MIITVFKFKEQHNTLFAYDAPKQHTASGDTMLLCLVNWNHASFYSCGTWILWYSFMNALNNIKLEYSFQQNDKFESCCFVYFPHSLVWIAWAVLRLLVVGRQTIFNENIHNSLVGVLFMEIVVFRSTYDICYLLTQAVLFFNRIILLDLTCIPNVEHKMCNANSLNGIAFV